MDKTLIWLLVSSALVILYYLQASARYKRLSYDLEEYLLAGKRMSKGRFILATTTVSILGLIALPYAGLFYRAGLSPGFMALAAIVVPFTIALFARRLWILSRIYNPLTPARLFGDYFRSNAMRSLTALVAVLTAVTLTVMSLRLGATLVESLIENGTSLGANTRLASMIAPLTMATMAALLFFHTAWGGMGAVLRLAGIAGLALFIGLAIILLIAIEAPGNFGNFLDRLAAMNHKSIGTPPPVPGAFPPELVEGYIIWPGMMATSCLFALAGLAITPSILMTSLIPAKGNGHAPAQALAATLLIGLIFLTSIIMLALAARLTALYPGLVSDGSSGMLLPRKFGEEAKLIVQLLLASVPRTPLLTTLITLSLLGALIASAAAALMAAGGMISNDMFYERLKRNHRLNDRKSITRYAIGLLIVLALALAWRTPADPLPLLLLTGAFGLQLLPALAGLCYFKRLTPRAVRNGLAAGLFMVVTTSTMTQVRADLADISLPFGAWPYALHYAVWGLGVNLVILFLSLMIRPKGAALTQHEKQLEYQRSFHVLPDGQPLMPSDAPKWRVIAWLLGALFLLVTTVPVIGNTNTALLPVATFSSWSWQILSWIIGLALVYVVAYRLQPVFDPEQALAGSLNPQKRRFRVKAQMRRVDELPTKTSRDNETD